MPGSGWQITSQLTNQVENTAAGQTVIGTRVFFVTGNGNEGSVFIPDNIYKPREVRERVKAHAALLDEVGNLSENFG